MSVRNRLALILGLALLPLLLGAGVVVAVFVPDRLAGEAQLRLTTTANAVAALQVQACLGVGDSARVMSLAVAKGEPAPAALESGLDRRAGYGTILVAGRTEATSDPLPSGIVWDTGREHPCSAATPAPSSEGSDTELSAADEDTPNLQDSVDAPSADGTVRSVVAFVMDQAQLLDWWRSLGGDMSIDLAVSCPTSGQASSARGERGAELEEYAEAVQRGVRGSLPEGEVASVAPGEGHPCAVVAGVQQVGPLAGGWLTWALLGLAAVLGAVTVWWLARQLTLPVLAVTDAAERAADGDLHVRLPAHRDDELGRLSASFNHMATQLDQRLREVEHSRDLLAENLQRLGDALQRTHDLDGLLATVCAISASATGSERASAWLVEGNSLVCRVSWPADSLRARGGRVPLEGSLPGRVVSEGGAVALPGAPADGSRPSLGSPLQRGDSMLGAVVVERAPTAPGYSEEDAATLTSITGPAGIAMDNALLHRQAQRMSVIDPLTGVGNLRMLTTTLAGEVERARYFERSVSLLILDLDHFRELNDTYGHAAGDAVLGAVAARVVASARGVDRVARYGGEEFAVVCPELDPTGALALAQRLWDAVRAEPFDVEGQRIVVRISIGVASWPQQARTSTELIRAADAAVSSAKRSGRDRVAQAADPAR